MWSFDACHVEALLKRGVRTLCFNEDQDVVCNWGGTERWLDESEWTGRRESNEAGREGWVLYNKSAGWKRKSPPLSFVYVRGAVHIVSLNLSHTLRTH
ncbi:hypothetical protein BDM02DRAFT_3099559 [Thelephora ganbajun]|uniref:Uncharacterized protein n=1 Tax=Thelephora ganbajun TaxID=370292 RepID=A0ACB6ZAP6_THEGA|nr:hypothetical protein BDM02DRAFT_3099559 [Thelephora ganbajun]